MVALLYRSPTLCRVYRRPGMDPWASGEVREVEEDLAVELLTHHPLWFSTASLSIAPAVPSLSRDAPPRIHDGGGAALGFRDLQRACKARGLSAHGSADVLRQRLTAAG